MQKDWGKIRKKWQNQQLYNITRPRTLASGRPDLYRPVRSKGGKRSSSWHQAEFHCRLTYFENSCSWQRARMIFFLLFLLHEDVLAVVSQVLKGIFLSLGSRADPSLFRRCPLPFPFEKSSQFPLCFERLIYFCNHNYVGKGWCDRGKISLVFSAYGLYSFGTWEHLFICELPCLLIL